MFHGKMKALTFSYDDGVTQDRQLLRILEKYDLRATFNLNSGLFGEAHAFFDERKNVTFPHVRFRASEIAGRYAGHEVAAHTRTHAELQTLSDEEVLAEVELDRKALSEICGYDVTGFAYPFGTAAATDRVRRLLQTGTGIRYARTTTSTHAFALPEDPLLWHPTARHAEKDALLRLGEQFLALDARTPQVFLLWGHSYEFERDDDWDRFDAFCRLMSRRGDIFYGTMREIFP